MKMKEIEFVISEILKNSKDSLLFSDGIIHFMKDTSKVKRTVENVCGP